MAESKYGKYIIAGEDCNFPTEGPGWIQILTDKEFRGSNYYSLHWVFPGRPHTETEVGHPPHMHKEPEILFLIGTDPENPFDLGGDVEISLGPEMEKHVISRTSVLCFPPGFPHGFYRTVNTKRPWIMFRVHQATVNTQKVLPEYLTDEQKSQVDWSVFKDSGFED
jgi:hypothetical protein